MWIKICANTNLDDAQLAAGLGADAVGFVFSRSTRRVTPAEVARITPHLPVSVERIGVFPALDADEIARAAREAGLTAVQLHGGVSITLIRQLHEILNGEISLIQTVHWNIDAGDANAAVVTQHLRDIATDGLVDRVLLDSKTSSASGGTGITFDWNSARVALAEAATGLQVIVAGGLRPENVSEAIARLNPWGVDVASGVEQSPGRKSQEKLAAFLYAARNS
jgi:phosphoribosylanthranilate isomerase